MKTTFRPFSLADVTPSLADVTPSLADVTPSLAELTPSLADLTLSLADLTLSLTDLTPSLADLTPSLTDLTPSDAQKGTVTEEKPSTSPAPLAGMAGFPFRRLVAAAALLLGAFLTLAAVPAALAAPFTNGSFESPGGVTEQFFGTGSTAITGWLIESGDGLDYEGPGNSHGWTAQDGSYGVSFGQSGAQGDTISQTFDTVPGQAYKVNAQVAQIQFDGFDGQTMSIEAFDGANSLATAVSTRIGPSSNAWKAANSYYFVATSTSTRLVFKDTTTGGSGTNSNWALDNVTVSSSVGPGDRDASFGPGGIVVTQVGGRGDFGRAVVVQGDSKVVVAGYSFDTSANVYFSAVRYTPEGALDATFGTNGKASTFITSLSGQATGAAVQSDGKIIVVGFATDPNIGANDFVLVRFNADGTLDTSFGSGGSVFTSIGTAGANATAVALQSDGKIVAVGYAADNSGSNHFAVARYNPDGSLDGTFAGGKVITPVGSFPDQATSVALQADGKIVVGGTSGFGGGNYAALLRYLSDGTLDPAFGTGGMVTTAFGPNSSAVQGVAVQGDGKIVVAGSIVSGSDSFAVARYTTAGVLDASFGTSGIVTTPVGTGNADAFAVAVQANGKVVVAGNAIAGSSVFAVVRYTAAGALDSTFGASGTVLTPIALSNNTARAVAVQPDGRIVVGGNGQNLGQFNKFEVVRYLGDVPAQVTINFDNIVPGLQDADFLASYGISSITYGGAAGARGPYVAGGDLGNSIAPSAPNIFYQSITSNDQNQDHFLTFTFTTPLTSLGLSRVGKTGFGSTDSWHADFYDANNNLLGSFGGSPVINSPVTPYSFTTPGAPIASMKLVSNWTGFATNATIPVDDFVLTPATTPVSADILYVANYGDGTIEKVLNNGSGSVFASTGLSNPVGLAFDHAGNLYAANFGNSTIRKLSPTGTDLGTFGTSGLNGPIGLAFDAVGNLFVSNNSNTIVKFDPAGTALGVFASAGLAHPYGLAFDGAGNLYVANYTDSTIRKFSPAGASLGVFASSGLIGPTGLAFDSAGNLYAANYNGNTVEKFSPAGTDLGVFATSGLSSPAGLAFDSAGNLYVSSVGNNTIRKFSATGTDLGVFASTGLNMPLLMTFAPLPQMLVENVPSNVTANGATLNATVNPGGLATTVSFYVDGLLVGTVNVPAGSADVPVSFDVSGLSLGLHTFSVTAQNSTATATGATISFATTLSYVLQDLNGSASLSVAHGVNNHGEVVGIANGRGFIWSAGTTTTLGDFGGSYAGVASDALSINDLGQVVGTAYFGDSAHTHHAFLYSSGSMTDLGTLYGGNSSALDINNAGQITGWSGDFPSYGTPFLYSGGTMRDLGSFGYNAAGQAINDSGQVVGKSNGYDQYGYRGFLYSNGTLTPLTPQYGDAVAINDAGNVVGSYGFGDSVSHAYVYSGGLSDFYYPGYGVGLNSVGQFLAVDFANYNPSKLLLVSGGQAFIVENLVTNPSGDGRYYVSGAKSINDWGQIAVTGYFGSSQHALLLSPTTPFFTTTGDSRDTKFVQGMDYSLFTPLTRGGGSTANLRGGAAGANRDVVVSLADRTTANGSVPTSIVSDVTNLSGSATDTVVLQLSYDSAASGAPVLAYFNGTSWVNAVRGNTGGTASFVSGAYDGSATLGRYGVDATNHVAWAVVNHNSQFAVLTTNNVAPSLSASAATNVNGSGASLGATVDTGGLQTTVTFYLDGVAVGTTTLAGDVTTVPVSFAVSGLGANSHHTFYITVQNAQGSATGPTGNFATAPQYVAIDLMPTFCYTGQATGLNNHGDVTITANFADNIHSQHGWLWSAGTFTYIPDFGGGQSGASAVNDAGQVTGSATYPPTIVGAPQLGHAFIFHNGTLTDLGTLGGLESTGVAINAAGHVVGNSDGAAFFYDGAMHNLGGINSSISATGINDLDQICGNLGYSAALYSGGTWSQIGPATYITFSSILTTTALGINDAGVVVGREFVSAGTANTYAVVFPGGGNVQSLPVTSNSAEARDINNAGQIVGGFFDGQYESLLVTGGSTYDLTSITTLPTGVVKVTGGNAINEWGQIAASGSDGVNFHPLLLSPTTPYFTTTGDSRDTKFVRGMDFGLFSPLTRSGGSTAKLLGGTAGANRDVIVSLANNSGAMNPPASGIHSDIASMSGSGLDAVVVQLSYETAVSGTPVLAWFNGIEWVNAVAGNVGGTPAFVNGAYDGDATLGHYGVDTTNHVAWAVVNHSSQFAVTGPLPFSVTTGAVTDITTTTATLHATVNLEGLAASVYFYEGFSPLGFVNVPAGSTTVAVDLPASGFVPGSLHTVYAVAYDTQNNVSGSNVSFTLLGGSPTVTTLTPSPIATTSATLHATVNPNGVDSQVYFYEGFTPLAGPINVSAGFADVPVDAAVSGFVPGTLHHVYAVVYNANFNVSSNTVDFTLLGGSPIVTTLTPSPIATTSATLHATVNPNGVDSQVYFYEGFTPLAGPINVSAGFADVPVDAAVGGFVPGTLHHVYAVVYNAYFNVNSNTVNFTLLGGPPIVTTLAPSPIGSTTATLQATVNPNGVDTAVYFYEGFSPLVGPINVPAGFTPVTVTAPISGLIENSTHTVVATVYNAYFNVSGAPVTFTTLSTTPTSGVSIELLRGDLVPTQPSGAMFSLLRPPMINASGHLSLKGTTFVNNGANPVTTANDLMIWADKGSTPLALIAREGDDAPGVTGGKFANFSDPVQSANDAVTFKANLKMGLGGVTSANDEAIYTDLGGTLTLVAREGTPSPVAGATFKSFNSVAVVDAGVFGIATLKGASITMTNDTVLWTWRPNESPVVRLREGDVFNLGSPRVVKSFDLLGAKAGVTGQGRTFSATPELAVRVQFTDGSVAQAHFSNSVNLFDLLTWDLTLLKNSPPVAVPTAPLGTAFATIEAPAINGHGYRAFRGTIAQRKTTPIVTAANDGVLWADQPGTPLAVIAREGDPAGTTGSTFATFGDPVISEQDRVAFLGTIKTNAALGITSSSDLCLWSQTDAGLTLIAREGVTHTSLPTGTVINSFTNVIATNTGGAFTGKLRTNVGGVTANSDAFLALWRASDGAFTIALREGQWLEVASGHPRQLKSFDVFTPEAPFTGMGRSFNAAGQIAVYCTFIDGSTGIFMIALNSSGGGGGGGGLGGGGLGVGGGGVGGVGLGGM